MLKRTTRRSSTSWIPPTLGDLPRIEPHTWWCGREHERARFRLLQAWRCGATEAEDAVGEVRSWMDRVRAREHRH